MKLQDKNIAASKVLSTIFSCETNEQLDVAFFMMSRFRKLYDEYSGEYTYLSVAFNHKRSLLDLEEMLSDMSERRS